MPENAFDVRGRRVLLLHPEKPYGREIALGLHRLEAEVALCGPDAQAMRQLAAELGLPESVLFPYCPGTEKAAETLAERVSRQIGPPDALVLVNPGSGLDTWTPDFDQLLASLRVSQLGLMLSVKHLGLLMAGERRGSVLFITDYGALVGYDPENYREEPLLFKRDFALDRGFASGACVNYARQAAGFLGEHNIRCNVLAFGPLPDEGHPAFTEAILRHSHLKRTLTMDDVAHAVAFFLSDASSFITGVTLPVDGGYTAK